MWTPPFRCDDRCAFGPFRHQFAIFAGARPRWQSFTSAALASGDVSMHAGQPPLVPQMSTHCLKTWQYPMQSHESFEKGQYWLREACMGSLVLAVELPVKQPSPSSSLGCIFKLHLQDEDGQLVHAASMLQVKLLPIHHRSIVELNRWERCVWRQYQMAGTDLVLHN